VEMSTNQIRLYDLFRKELRLPDDKAAAFVKAVGDVVESEAVGKNHLLATKEDIHILKRDIHSLDLKIVQSKTDIYKAIFMAGVIIQIIAILSGTLAIVKWMK
jgi:hypothetical protein